MRNLTSTIAILGLVAHAAAQCPDYSSGQISAGIGKFNGGDEARLVYVDCLDSIAFIDAKFGNPGASTPLDGLPLTLAVYDDPTDDKHPGDAALVASVQVPGGVTGAHTDVWQRYDLIALTGAPIPTTGGMFVAVGVTYPAGGQPASIEFFNNAFPQTQWLMTDNGGTLDYNTPSNNRLLDVSTGPGFPPGTWIVRAEGNAEHHSFGSGCSGTNGTPSVQGVPAALPVLGQAMALMIINLPDPARPAVLGIGFSRLATPLDLSVIGMTGCSLDIDLQLSTPLTPAGGIATWGVSIPAVPALAGAVLYSQASAIDPGANAFGATTSNALRTTIGR